MSRLVDLNITRYQWVPGVAGLTTPAAPKITEVAAVGAKHISPYVLPTTDIGPADSDTVQDKTITDIANVDTPTIRNYAGALNLMRSFTAGAPATDDLTAVFTQGSFGWIWRREGKDPAVAPAIGDVCDVFLFLVDAVKKTAGTGNGMAKLNIKLLPQGVFYTDVVCVA